MSTVQERVLIRQSKLTLYRWLLFLLSSPGTLSGCLEERKAQRTTWDLLPEGVMLLLALILSKLPEFLIAAFWRSIR